MFDVKRVFAEKKIGFNTESTNLLNDFKENLQLDNLKNVRILNRYLVAGLNDQDFYKAVTAVFSEPNQDDVYFGDIEAADNTFAVEFLPGQYDQRADSASQCIQVITGLDYIKVKYAKIIILEGELTKEEIQKVKNYYINPVDSRETDVDGFETFDDVYDEAQDVDILENFINKSLGEVQELLNNLGLAMSLEDLLFCQEYFKNTEKRNPTITEIKVIDTYWSDHCRHTTFNTKINNVDFEKGKIIEEIKKTFQEYLASRQFVHGKNDKDISLMDLATINAKELRKSGKLNDLEISDEINACSIIINVDVQGKNEEWLLMFKNETHNHPTEIEPFGGAATCIGGAIRDPLSGRAYVYQAMRVTGSGDPRQSIEETLPGKLPQRKISAEAASGYSSYGNQIGLATGFVNEIYHPGYIAKRMEVGAVIAAVKRENIIRETPAEGDAVILLGGRTGRDGLGGATGSSKEHDEKSIIKSGSEVQKGNAPTERKIQRLFRNEHVSILIKKCNDFGAGGVSVAIGELAEGLSINLDAIPKKYDGLDGTELAISESQERMAVVVSKENAQKFISYAQGENLEATIAAVVTGDKRLKMSWRGKTILDIDRKFLDTNGVKQTTDAKIKEPLSIFEEKKFHSGDLKDAWLENLRDLNVASQKGMVEKFDSTVGAGSVLMPFGGHTQLTPAEGIAAKIPVKNGTTDTCSVMTYGFDPYVSEKSPYHGAMYAVVHSVAKAVAMGADYKNIRLTFQEYFEKLNKVPESWGKVLSALLGAYKAQRELQIPAIGGKDSMSGTFMHLNVPPTLISFAVSSANAEYIISPEFKKPDNKVLLVKIKTCDNNIPDFDDLKNKYSLIHEHIQKGIVLSAHTVGCGGVAAAISKMSLGNNIGFKASFDLAFDKTQWFSCGYGDIVLEATQNFIGTEIGTTIGTEEISLGQGVSISLNEIKSNWLKTFENIYPLKKDIKESIGKIEAHGYKTKNPSGRFAKPRVFIPVFPGTNCEYDTQRAFENAGANADIFVFNNLSPLNISQSISEMKKRIGQSQIIAFPGGFSAGDEPEGSGKFIASVFRNEYLKEAVTDLLKNRDGLIIGICNGFQALIKLGLVPFGEIVDIMEDYPTLTYNKIGRHVSAFVKTKVVNNSSPWLYNCNEGDIHYLPVSHGEGRFAANEQWIQTLKNNGQIATQYVGENNEPTYDGYYNPNGSTEAIEGITSPDGRVFGKMAHSERIGKNLYKNIPGEKNQLIFESGVQYFK